MNKSKVKEISNDDEMLFNTWKKIEEKAPKNSNTIAWLDNELIIDTFEKFSQQFKDNDLKLIQRMRIFTQDAELLIWRNNGNLKGRLRDDKKTRNPNEKLEYIESEQLLWGTSAEEKDGYILLTEDRGTNLKIPKFFEGNVDKNKRIFIKTRNYIDYTPACHATYVDHRFVKFIVK